jgi:Ferritin-like domain
LEETNMTDEHHADRRSFLRTGAIAGTALAVGASGTFAQDAADADASKRPTKGDIDILRFLAAIEILETDLWQQYNELGGIQDGEVPGGTGSPAYTAALKNLDGDMDQYIHDNTEDEFTHFTFINAFLKSKGAQPVNLDKFRTLMGSTATGVDKTKIGKRLTNLTALTIDTSYWTRYRDPNHNPDLDGFSVFPQAIPDLFKGPHTAIPRTDADLTPDKHIQAIANTAAFHFASIEQGGSSLYPALARRVTNPEVLLILLSIGPTETMHFQTWQDKAGNAAKNPLAPLIDPTNGLTFPNLNASPFGGELFQTNLIMPEPCPFISRNFPRCSIIRPILTFGAVAAVTGLAASGLFTGQPPAFFAAATALARAADAATRECDVV